ncbi:hypothetical protein CRUP_014211 [Coryphaenoides rupestris]|nr:hypothetical protein CRUP_014211 [Coryphaenoides rupestris]
MDDILENLEEVEITARGDDEDEDDEDEEVPPELLLGRDQLIELSQESAKIKAMGIIDRAGDDGADEDRRAPDDRVDRVSGSADACLAALHVMTSPAMPKAVYIEDVIEMVLRTSNQKAKRPKCPSHRQKVVTLLYNKLCDVFRNLSELLSIQLLTDTTVLQMTSMAMTPFFVENVRELQLCSIKLVTAVFARYKKHRQLILEEVFTSLARLPTSKRSLRHFRVNSSGVGTEPLYIQMVSALVLQLIQSVVQLRSQTHPEKEDEDELITGSYEAAMRTSQNFLLVFLKKCGSKQGEEDYRPVFENFVQDLLTVLNQPEWPAAEVLLGLLGRLLVYQFSTKQTEMALRVASLDYLGTVATHLRKDAIPGSRDETLRLQKALLNYLEDNGERDSSLAFARSFYIAQWLRDSTTETQKAAELPDSAPDIRRPKPPGDTAAAVAMPLRPPVELLDLVAVCCPGSRKEERPQIGRVIQKTGDGGGYTVHWMSGSYGGPWAESRRRDPGGRGGGAKLVPITGSVREEDIIYRKIALTSGRKLSSRVVQALRGLYAEKDGKKK